MKEPPVPHGLGTADNPNVPVIEFANNTERVGDVELTLSLQDAYDTTNSDLSSEISQIRLAYIKLKGEGEEITDDYVQQVESTGIMALSTDGDADFMEKNLNSQAVENLKNDLEDHIYSGSNSYNPDKISDSNVTAYQIRQRLFKLEAATAEREAIFRVALERLWKMFIEYYTRLGVISGITIEDIDFEFQRNTPRNRLADLELAARAGVMISNRTKLELSELGIDPEEEIKRLEEDFESAEEQISEEVRRAMAQMEVTDQTEEAAEIQDGVENAGNNT